MALVQKWPFVQLFFSGDIGQKNFPYDILEQKKRLSRPNTRSSKIQKIDVFPTGLTHAFGPKVAIFANFFFRQYRPGKCLLRYSRTKKRLSRL